MSFLIMPFSDCPEIEREPEKSKWGPKENTLKMAKVPFS